MDRRRSPARAPACWRGCPALGSDRAGANGLLPPASVSLHEQQPPPQAHNTQQQDSSGKARKDKQERRGGKRRRTATRAVVSRARPCVIFTSPPGSAAFPEVLPWRGLLWVGGTSNGKGPAGRGARACVRASVLSPSGHSALQFTETQSRGSNDARAASAPQGAERQQHGAYTHALSSRQEQQAGPRLRNVKVSLLRQRIHRVGARASDAHSAAQAVTWPPQSCYLLGAPGQGGPGGDPASAPHMSGRGRARAQAGAAQHDGRFWRFSPGGPPRAVLLRGARRGGAATGSAGPPCCRTNDTQEAWRGITKQTAGSATPADSNTQKSMHCNAARATGAHAE